VANQPNIVFVMGDDIGMWNIGAYHRGMLAGRTPNIDRLAAEGALFTDYYAEASCTAGRCNFITGQLPIRTGLVTVGQAGASVGMPEGSPSVGTALQKLGYATGQFGKNHLGDRNEYLPTVHGFDEFFGYLYHLDAMEDPFAPDYPQELLDRVGPRNLIHSFATDVADDTEDPRWGRVGKQRIEDKGQLPPHPTEGIEHNMETIDEVIRDYAIEFIERNVAADKPFFCYLNPTRMHVFTYLSQKYRDMMDSEDEWTLQEAGMKQFDDVIGAVMHKLEELGVADNTIFVVTTDNGAETFTWPDGGISPFAGAKGSVQEGGFRVPCIARWPGHIEAGSVQNGLISGLDWFPTFSAAAGDPDIVEELKSGASLNGSHYKVHLDGYNQLGLLEGDSESARNEIWYFTEATFSGARIGNFKYVFTDQPQGWLGNTVELDFPRVYNLRLDPFERAGFDDSLMSFRWYGNEFWRFVFVQQEVEKLAQSFIEFPQAQAPASFNMEAIQAQVAKARAGHAGK
jgi:arylsulfatase